MWWWTISRTSGVAGLGRARLHVTTPVRPAGLRQDRVGNQMLTLLWPFGWASVEVQELPGLSLFSSAQVFVRRLKA